MPDVPANGRPRGNPRLREAVAGGQRPFATASWARAQALTRWVDDLDRSFSGIYERMLLDEQVSACLGAFADAVLADGLQVRPPKALDDRKHPDYRRAVREVEFTERALDRAGCQPDLWLGALMKAPGLGNVACEVTMEPVEAGPDAGRWSLAQVKDKSRDAYRLVVDPFMNLLGLLAATPGSPSPPSSGPLDPEKLRDDPRFVPRTKWVVHSWEPVAANPQGSSALRCVYEPWFGKREAGRDFILHLHQFGSPYLYAVLGEAAGKALPETDEELALAGPAGEDPVTAALEALMRFKGGEVGVFGPGTKIDLLQSSGLAQGFLAAIDSFDRRIARGILGAIRAVMESQYGSKRDSETAQDVTGNKFRRTKRLLAGVVTWDLFYQLSLVNLGPHLAERLCPRASLSAVEHQDFSKVVAVGALRGVTTQSQDQWFLEQFGFPPPTEGELQEQARQKQQQAQPPGPFGGGGGPFEGGAPFALPPHFTGWSPEPDAMGRRYYWINGVRAPGPGEAGGGAGQVAFRHKAPPFTAEVTGAGAVTVLRGRKVVQHVAPDGTPAVPDAPPEALAVAREALARAKAAYGGRLPGQAAEAAGGAAGASPALREAAADVVRLNEALTDARAKLPPLIPRLYDALRGRHPGLSEEDFHGLLAEMARADLLTPQAWGGGTAEMLARSTGYPLSRFPRHPRFGYAAWIAVRPDAARRLAAGDVPFSLPPHFTGWAEPDAAGRVYYYEDGKRVPGRERGREKARREKRLSRETEQARTLVSRARARVEGYPALHASVAVLGDSLQAAAPLGKKADLLRVLDPKRAGRLASRAVKAALKGQLASVREQADALFGPKAGKVLRGLAQAEGDYAADLAGGVRSAVKYARSLLRGPDAGRGAPLRELASSLAGLSAPGRAQEAFEGAFGRFEDFSLDASTAMHEAGWPRGLDPEEDQAAVDARHQQAARALYDAYRQALAAWQGPGTAPFAAHPPGEDATLLAAFGLPPHYTGPAEDSLGRRYYFQDGRRIPGDAGEGGPVAPPTLLGLSDVRGLEAEVADAEARGVPLRYDEADAYQSDLFDCLYAVGRLGDRYVYVWSNRGPGEGEVPLDALKDPEATHGALVGTREQVLHELDVCVGSFREWGDEAQQAEAARIVEQLSAVLSADAAFGLPPHYTGPYEDSLNRRYYFREGRRIPGPPAEKADRVHALEQQRLTLRGTVAKGIQAALAQPGDAVKKAKAAARAALDAYRQGGAGAVSRLAVRAAGRKALASFRKAEARYGRPAACAMAAGWLGCYASYALNPALAVFIPSPLGVVFGVAEAVRQLGRGARRVKRAAGFSLAEGSDRGVDYFPEPATELAHPEEVDDSEPPLA